MGKLGSRLKEAREKKRFTQMEVSSKLGISNGTLSGYERNYRDPDTDTLSKLAELYEVSIDWLKGRTDEKETALMMNTVMDFANDDIFNGPVYYKGMELNLAEKKELIAIIRAIIDARQAVR